MYWALDTRLDRTVAIKDSLLGSYGGTCRLDEALPYRIQIADGLTAAH